MYGKGLRETFAKEEAYGTIKGHEIHIFGRTLDGVGNIKDKLEWGIGNRMSLKNLTDHWLEKMLSKLT